jgi:gas vesicle protein
MRTNGLRTDNSAVLFLAGMGVGVAAAIVLAPVAGRRTRSRIGEFVRPVANAIETRAKDLSAAAGELVQEGKLSLRDKHDSAHETMSGLKDKAKNKIDDAVEASTKAAHKVVDESKDAAHSAGQKLENVGNRLQDA